MNEIVFTRKCSRCNSELTYVNEIYFNEVSKESSNVCKVCKVVPDSNLEELKQNQQYTRICNVCNNVIVYKNRNSYRGAVRLNKPCKSCALLLSPKISEKKEKLKKEWSRIIGTESFKYRTFVMVRKHWNEISEAERQKIASKTPLQKKYYWGHLRRWNRNAGHRKCREVMAVKWSGNNHWMKRPGVLEKIKKSCEKYRGDGHWFRRNKKVD